MSKEMGIDSSKQTKIHVYEKSRLEERDLSKGPICVFVVFNYVSLISSHY